MKSIFRIAKDVEAKKRAEYLAAIDHALPENPQQDDAGEVSEFELQDEFAAVMWLVLIGLLVLAAVGFLAGLVAR